MTFVQIHKKATINWKLVKTAAKDKMIENMTKFQIGTKPGHRAQEHIYV